MPKRSQLLCTTDNLTEFSTASGGTLAYGPCKKHGYFTAIVHCHPSDVRLLAEALLEAVNHVETKH